MKNLILFTAIALILAVNADAQEAINTSTPKLKPATVILPDSIIHLQNKSTMENSSVRLVCNCGLIHNPLWLVTYHGTKYVLDSIGASSINTNWIKEIHISRDTAAYNRYGRDAMYGIVSVILKDIHLTALDSLKVFGAHKSIITSVVLTPPPGYHGSHSLPLKVGLENVKDSIGRKVTIEGKVFGYKKLSNMTLVDLGGPNPNQLLTIVFKRKAKKYFDYFPIDGKSIFIIGKISEFKGKPRIVVTDANSFGVY
ncbi:MAG: hypothetical protein JWQ63_1512 [Mucilaginibacter sp.]|nr:hypothetical protein [Mucilaginibacter sp.]